MKLQYRVTRAAILACLIGIPGIAHAAFIPPDGVTEYRLAFETPSFIQATSTDISTYNAYVTAQSATEGSLPNTTWTAIASTASVSAAQNIACGSVCDATVPIYLIDGATEVATSTDAMFAGAILTPIGIAGAVHGDYPFAWTGSNSNGSAAVGFELGTADPVVGAAAAASTAMLDAEEGVASSQLGLPLYAISGELFNSAAVPEPMSLSLLGLAGIATGLIKIAPRRHRALT